MTAKFALPCIPTTAKAIPQGDAWLHEPKLDGYRFQIVKEVTTHMLNADASGRVIHNRYVPHLTAQAAAYDYVDTQGRVALT